MFRTEEFEIEGYNDLHLVVIKGEFTGIRYIVEDKNGDTCGSSKKNWKKALYNYKRNKKRKEGKENGR